MALWTTEEMPPDALEPDEYHCPYCGGSAPPDQWWTEEQVQTLQGAALHEAMPEVERQLREAFKPLAKSGLIRTDIRTEPVNPPSPLSEPDCLLVPAPPGAGPQVPDPAGQPVSRPPREALERAQPVEALAGDSFLAGGAVPGRGQWGLDASEELIQQLANVDEKSFAFWYPEFLHPSLHEASASVNCDSSPSENLSNRGGVS